MNQNPRQTPMPHTECDDDTAVPLIQRFREFTNAHRRWSRRCWLYGVIAVVVGISGTNLLQLISVERSPAWLVYAIDGVSICFVAAGFGLIVFGPITWFWVRKGR